MACGMIAPPPTPGGATPDAAPTSTARVTEPPTSTTPAQPLATLTPAPTTTTAPIFVDAPAPTAPRGDVFEIRAISAAVPGLKSERVRVAMTLDGSVDNGAKPAKGALAVDLRNDVTANKRAMNLSGDLMQAFLPEQVSLLAPESVDVFETKNYMLVAVNSFFSVCARPKGSLAQTDLTAAFAPEYFVTRLGLALGETQGKLTGEEEIGGVRARRYAIDRDWLKANAAPGSPAQTAKLTTADVWVAVDGGYMVQARIVGSGAIKIPALNGYSGAFDIQLTRGEVNAPQKTDAPASCANPIEVN
jgi:hypothetical protein